MLAPWVVFSKISTPSRTRPPPKTVAVPPIMHPQANAKNIPFPKTESSGFNLSALTISKTMGNIIAATACSDMKQELNAAKK